MITYTVTENTTEKRVTNLALFLMCFKYLFTARAVPSYKIVNSLCWDGDIRLDEGRVIWEHFEVSEKEYVAAMFILRRTLGLKDREIPACVDNPFKWVIWQYQLSHNVPYSEHLELAEYESKCKLMLENAIENGNEEDQLQMHVQYVQAVTNLEEFLEGYLTEAR